MREGDDSARGKGTCITVHNHRETNETSERFGNRRKPLEARDPLANGLERIELALDRQRLRLTPFSLFLF